MLVMYQLVEQHSGLKLSQSLATCERLAFSLNCDKPVIMHTCTLLQQGLKDNSDAKNMTDYP